MHCTDRVKFAFLMTNRPPSQSSSEVREVQQLRVHRARRKKAAVVSCSTFTVIKCRSLCPALYMHNAMHGSLSLSHGLLGRIFTHIFVIYRGDKEMEKSAGLFICSVSAGQQLMRLAVVLADQTSNLFCSHIFSLYMLLVKLNCELTDAFHSP